MDTIILQALEHIRCPFLDVFFGLFTALGEELVIAAVIGVVYLCLDKRTGEQALLTVIGASCVTAAVKSGVRRLRPYAQGTVQKVEIDNLLVSTADLDPDMSFPSGHATATSGFFATLALRLRRAWAIALCVGFTLLVMLSRLYLGVHYPTDVLTGLGIGLLFAFGWQWVYHRWYNARLYIYLALALLTLPCLFIPRTATDSMFQISSVALASAAALLIEDRLIRFANADRLWKRALRLVLTAAVAAIPFLILHFLLPEGQWFDFITYFTTLFLAMTLAPLLFRRLGL